MNFYRDDVAELVRIFGQGWTSEVREIIAQYIVRRMVREDFPNEQ